MMPLRHVSVASILLLAHLHLGLVRKINLSVALEEPAAIVDKKFLSFTLSAGAVRHSFRRLNFASSKLLALARALNAGRKFPQIYLRFGGSLQDRCVFDPAGIYDAEYLRREKLYVLNSIDINKVCAFVKTLKWKLVVGLNSLLRHADGSWDPTNAIALMEYAKKKRCAMQFELGNEPDLYPSHFNLTIAPSQLAEDFVTLRRVIDDVMGKGTLLLGPDIATLTRHDYFRRFLSAVPSEVLSAVTFHHYYSSSASITVQNFTSIPYLDSFATYCKLAKAIVKKSFEGRREPPVWIGETSSTYGGGSKYAGQSFAAGFLWLDKLGLAAQLNISVVIRQSIKGGWYSLLTKNYDPTPDYWTSLIYKRLVGHVVLNVTGFLEPGRAVRVYAHCVIPDDAKRYKHGDIVLIVLNVDDEPVLLNPNGLAHGDAFAYILTPANGKLDDKTVNLNGEVLKMVDDVALPDIHPAPVPFPVILPSYSYGFIVVTKVKAKACKV